ncbi:MAG: hypothetical protein RAO94_04385 [Candidatus Stygibacter australis]|nr:hypothetical protein [Candidatus Stygibacter australis]MDP8321573.1 hypothetical protein [Candidatus Stygibacter australis]
MDFFKVQHLKHYNSDSEYYDMLYNIAISLGNKAYLSDHFYIRNQLNMHIPVDGDDLKYDSNWMKPGPFFMDFEFLVLDLTF